MDLNEAVADRDAKYELYREAYSEWWRAVQVVTAIADEQAEMVR